MPPRKPAPTRLVLIRTANGERPDGPARLIDHDDLGLSALGQHQVQALADRLASTGELAGATRLHCGSSNRARQTAVALAPTLGGLPVEASCGFCEPHSGSAEGRTVDDWLATDGQTRLEHWSPYAPKGPGGESVTIGMDRAARALIEAVLDDEGGTTIIVAHTVPIRASLWCFLGLPFHGSHLDTEITETGITEWVVEGWLPGTGQPRARLVRHNDSAHLAGISSLSRKA